MYHKCTDEILKLQLQEIWDLLEKARNFKLWESSTKELNVEFIYNQIKILTLYCGELTHSHVAYDIVCIFNTLWKGTIPPKLDPNKTILFAGQGTRGGYGTANNLNVRDKNGYIRLIDLGGNIAQGTNDDIYKRYTAICEIEETTPIAFDASDFDDIYCQAQMEIRILNKMELNMDNYQLNKANAESRLVNTSTDTAKFASIGTESLDFYMELQRKWKELERKLEE